MIGKLYKMTLETANTLFKELVQHKNVVLIGPGRTESDNTAIIRNADTVIRCGQSLPVEEKNKKQYGTRTDIVYNSLDNDQISGGHIDNLIKIWQSEEIKLVCATYPQEARILNNILQVKKHFLVKNMSNLLYSSYKEKLESRPNSGFCAFIDIFHAKPNSMHIIGIDFFRSLCFDGYKTTMGHWNHKDFLNDMEPGKSQEHHNPDKQFIIYKNICKKFNFITVDKQIEFYFNNKKYNKLINLL